MVDKSQTVARERLGPTIGRLDDDSMLAVTRALAVFQGFAWAHCVATRIT
jgi:mRNA interferase MazF